MGFAHCLQISSSETKWLCALASREAGRGVTQQDSRGLLISRQAGLRGCLTHGELSRLTKAVFVLCVCKRLPFYSRQTFLVLAVYVLVLREAALSFTGFPALPEQISPAFITSHVGTPPPPALAATEEKLLLLGREYLSKGERRLRAAHLKEDCWPFPCCR